uniref:Uncharacterized protein n=1 Tax=Morchella brunnea TaxID=1174671 RepID=A0A8K1I8B8_9PEZI|nr:hypothetical protein LK370_mgp040 [Morchella brunnea]UBU98590.1 hypothetical protein [Morchella brunnea]
MVPAYIKVRKKSETINHDSLRAFTWPTLYSSEHNYLAGDFDIFLNTLIKAAFCFNITKSTGSKASPLRRRGDATFSVFFKKEKAAGLVFLYSYICIHFSKDLALIDINLCVLKYSIIVFELK